MTLEIDEDRTPHRRPQPFDVSEELARDGRLAVSDGERPQLPQHDVDGDDERRHRIDGLDASHDGAVPVEELVDHVVDRAGERQLRCDQGMDPPPRGGRIAHSRVVQVREQHPEADDERASLRRTLRKQDALDGLCEVDHSSGHVARVHDAVVREQRGMAMDSRGDGGVVAKRLERRARLHRAPEPRL